VGEEEEERRRRKGYSKLEEEDLLTIGK